MTLVILKQNVKNISGIQMKDFSTVFDLRTDECIATGIIDF